LLGRRALRDATPLPWRPIAQPPNAARLWARFAGSRLLGRQSLRTRRTAGMPIAQIPSAARHLRLPDPAVRAGRPALPALPGFPSGGARLGGEEFLLPTEYAAQGFSARTSRFFGRPQDICCLSPVHGCFPLTVHRLIHRSWGFLSRGRTVTDAVRPRRGDSEGASAVLVVTAQRKVRHDRRPRRPRSPP
jgi:hypothetical protein